MQKLRILKRYLSPFLGVLFLFFALPLRNTSHPVDVAKVLNTLPEDDKEALDCFFRCLYHEAFQYVLFGNKPMSICLFVKTDPYHASRYRVADFMDLSVGLANPMRLKTYRGWEVWKKYESLFPSSNFVFLESADQEYVSIILINKRAFLRKIEENIKFFREVLGREITPKKILGKCLKCNDLFKEVLNCNEGLFGILLGYGSRNARLFSRKQQIETMMNPQGFSVSKKSIFPSEGFCTIEEEYDHINATLASFTESQAMDFNPFLMTLPGFAADHSDPETQQLKTEYTKQYKKIMRIFKKENFLETTLNQFVGADL